MKNAKRHRYQLSVASATENLELIREFIGRLAREAGFDEDSAMQIELAVDEASTNVIKHAYRYNPAHTVDIIAQFDAEKMEIVISDRGKGFDANNVPAPDIAKKIAAAKPGGLGIHLMRSLMDEVHFSIHPKKRNEVKLVKYLKK
jgi:serine/threonine-protein kinase RsbW